MGGSQPSNVTQTTTTQLPQWARPYAQGLLEKSGGLANQAYTAYPYRTVSQLQPETYVGMNMITQRALQGSPVTNQAQNELVNTLGGGYLGLNNPYSQQIMGTPAYQSLEQMAQGAYTNPYAQGSFYQNLLGSQPGQTLGQYSSGQFLNPANNPSMSNWLSSPSQNQLQAYGAGQYLNPSANPTISQWLNSPSSQAMNALAGGTYLDPMNNPAMQDFYNSYAARNLSNAASGAYLSPESNPYIQATYNQAAQDLTRNWQNAVYPGIQAAASRAGAFGGSGHQLLQAESNRNLADQLGDLATNIYGANYARERQAQDAASQFLGNLRSQWGLGQQQLQAGAAGNLAQLANQYGLQQQQLQQAAGQFLGGQAQQYGLAQQGMQQGAAQNLAGLAQGQYNTGLAAQQGAASGILQQLMNQYNAERTNQIRSMFFAPQMAQQDYVDMQQLLGVGDVYRQYEQDLLGDYYNRWMQQQQWPYQQAQFMASMIPAAVGGQGTTSTTSPNPNYVNPASQVLSGAMGGIGTGLAAASLMNPYAAAGVGGLYFLSSLFG